MSAELVLLVATVVVVPGAVAIFVRDLRMGLDPTASPDDAALRGSTSRLRVISEAAVPLIGIAVLVGLAWVAL